MLDVSCLWFAKVTFISYCRLIKFMSSDVSNKMATSASQVKVSGEVLADL